MKKIFYLLSLCFIKLNLLACAIDDAREKNQRYEYIEDNPNAQYLGWAQSALAQWDIGLQNTNNTARLRNITPGYKSNPPNWITVSDEGCNAGGLPSSVKERCFTSDIAIGVCYTRYDREGAIYETTILVKESHLAGAVSDAEKESTFVHEVGHCLGLQHWGNTESDDSGLEPSVTADHQTHVMYPTNASVNTPKAEEISAVQALYNTDPNGCGDTNLSADCLSPLTLENANDCSQGADDTVPTVTHATYEGYAPCYYSQIKTTQTTFSEQRTYHKNFPHFTISSAIGNGAARAEMPERGPPMQGESFERIYILKSDGTEEVYTRKAKIE